MKMIIIVVILVDHKYLNIRKGDIIDICFTVSTIGETEF